MRIRLSIPDRHVTPNVLESVLEATTRANQAAISGGEVGSIVDAIRRGIKWRAEPFGDGEHFDLAQKVARRGWGDCDDLAPWLAAEMRAHGERARPRVYKSGPNKYHVVVEDSDGRIHDPSRWAGMKSISGVEGALARPMLPHGKSGFTLAKHKGRWWCRADVPWPRARRAHITSLARALAPQGALLRSVSGAVNVAGCIGADDDDVDELARAAELVMGDDDEDTGEVGFLGGLVKSVLPMAASMIPGGSMALDLAKGVLAPGGDAPKGGAAAPPVAPGGAPLGSSPDGGPSREAGSWVMYQPMGSAGPTVVRMR